MYLVLFYLKCIISSLVQYDKRKLEPFSLNLAKMEIYSILLKVPLLNNTVL